jgi:hypothetical protein
MQQESLMFTWLSGKRIRPLKRLQQPTRLFIRFTGVYANGMAANYDQFTHDDDLSLVTEGNEKLEVAEYAQRKVKAVKAQRERESLGGVRKVTRPVVCMSRSGGCNAADAVERHSGGQETASSCRRRIGRG